MYANIAIATLFATSALAVPAVSVPKTFSMPKVPTTKQPEVKFSAQAASAGEQWTVKDTTRSCNDDDSECTWNITVDTYKEGTDPYECEWTVEAADGKPASQSDVVDPVECEVFLITAGWAPSFTTIVPVHPETGRHIYASFDDAEVEDGKTADDKTLPVKVGNEA